MRAMRSVVRTCVTVALLICVAAVGESAAQDPGTPGPFAVTVEEYTFGDTAFMPSGFPGAVELTASVHYPTALASGPFPLIVFLHGRHATCHNGVSAFLEWPCTAGRSPIPSYRGYHYIGQVLASHGYIVVSVSANGINARDNSVLDLGMQARAELVQRHLDIWNGFNTAGGAPFGTKFVARVNLSNVGTMGHSRGGEGVVSHFNLNASLGSPYGVRAVFPLAPVDFHRFVVNNAALSVLLPYCDGDVADLQGVHYYDDARYNVPGDPSPKHTLLVMGANHNFYNTIWTPSIFAPGSADDWTAFVSGGSSDPHCGTGGAGRLTEAQQRGTGLAYITGFFRRYIGGETAFAPMFQGDVPPPPSAMTTAIHVSYHARNDPTTRRDVNRLLTETNLTTNTLGGAASQSGFTPYDLCGGDAPQPQHCLPGQPTSRQPHTTPSARSSRRGLSQLRGGWSATSAFYRNDLPAGFRDVSGFQVFQFRASVNFADARNPFGTAQNLSVLLRDGTGASASARVSDHSDALFYPPGSVGPVPKVVLNTIRIPLTAFSGVDLHDIRAVELRFNQTAQGALLISDLAFADPAGGGGGPGIARSFSCGASEFTQIVFGVSPGGALARFNSPGLSGHEHVGARSGYKLCYATAMGGPSVSAHDFRSTQSGWAPGTTLSQPNGPGTFPVEIARTTSDGRLRVTRRITGNSFIGPVPAGSPTYDSENGNGVGCDTLGECGNCTNRTAHVVTRIENISGGQVFNVELVELVDFNIDGAATGDRFARTADTAVAVKNTNGMIMQSLILPGDVQVYAAGDYDETAGTCAQAALALPTPTAAGDFEAVLRQSVGTLAPGSSSANNVRVHFRRF